MPRNFDDALSNSSLCFQRLVEKPLLDCLGGGRIVLVEGVDNDVARLLDLRAGIDALHDHPRFGVTGIALRIQFGENYETFTIRHRRENGGRTEFDKRIHSINYGDLSPKLTVQCYVDPNGEKLLGGAVARTQDLFTCIDQGKCRIQATSRDQIGQASFYVVDWKDVANLQPSPWCPVFGA